jgi:hypothetical protein
MPLRWQPARRASTGNFYLDQTTIGGLLDRIKSRLGNHLQ